MRTNDFELGTRANEHSAASACYACVECGREAEVEHHVVPRSRGGTKTLPLCERCHGKAHGRNMTTKVLTQEAMDRKKNRGERCGRVPYGFDLAADGMALCANSDEQGVLEVIRELREQGLSLRDIAGELNRRDIASKSGGPWIHSSIHRIVKRCEA